MTTATRFVAVLASTLVLSPGAWANIVPGELISEQGALCRAAVRQAELAWRLPPYLLGAIARVESGRRDPATGHFNPWPWTINAQGRDYYFDSKIAAVAFARNLTAQGVRSFDVGCMQINMAQHPSAFRDLDEAFDPAANALYAARFLTELKDKTFSWEEASAAYHSFTPELGRAYRAKVVLALAEETNTAGAFDALMPRMPGGAGPIVAGGLFQRSLPASGENVRLLSGYANSAGSAQVRAQGMTSGSTGRVILMAGSMGSPAQGGLGPAGIGRGLEAYRMRPVPIVAARPLITAAR